MKMQPSEFENAGLMFSYLDTGRDEGGDGRVLIALHAHLMDGQTFAPLAAALEPEWRMIAPDQRGHGYSSHAQSYTRGDYLGDLEALFAHLGMQQAVLLGNSLGGVNAYQFAARHPERVSALVIEDVGAVVSDDISFILPWAGVFATREELANQIGARFAPYFEDSFRQIENGWRLAFEPSEMVESQRWLCGDHWQDWLATDCPALLVRGRDSRVTTAEELEEMARRRPNTALVTLDGGHVPHKECPEEFNRAVLRFLTSLQV